MRIREMLSNEKYTGNALLMKQYRNNHIEKKKTRNRGELPMYYAEGTHDAIVDMETFNQAQEILKGFAETASSWERHHYSAFTGKILCACCGRNYRRIKNHKNHAWNCSTFQAEGKEKCPSVQIREDVLIKITAEAMGLPKFCEEAFQEQIAFIRAERDHVLVFHFQDGHEIEKVWQTPSRRGSWTPEMKEQARQHALKRWRNE